MRVVNGPCWPDRLGLLQEVVDGRQSDVVRACQWPRYRSRSLAGLPGFEGAGALMTIADGQLTVRLTRGVERLGEPRVRLAHVAHAISAGGARPRRRA